MIGTRGVGVAGVDTEEVDKSEILKILAYGLKSQKLLRNNDRVFNL